MRSRNMCSIATSTSVTRSIVLFLSTRTSPPTRAIIISPARTTTSTAVVKNNGSTVNSGSGEEGIARPIERHTLHHADFHPALRRALKLDFVHEIADQEDAASAALEQVFRCQRVRDLVGIEALPLIAHANGHLWNRSND